MHFNANTWAPTHLLQRLRLPERQENAAAGLAYRRRGQIIQAMRVRREWWPHTSAHGTYTPTTRTLPPIVASGSVFTRPQTISQWYKGAIPLGLQ